MNLALRLHHIKYDSSSRADSFIASIRDTVKNMSTFHRTSEMKDVNRGTWSLLPQETKDQIYKTLLRLRGGRYIIIDPEGWLRHQLPMGAFHQLTLGYDRPLYAGLLVASKEISEGIQMVLYKESVFNAYLCRDPDRNVSLPDPQLFARIQKIQFFLDVSLFFYRSNPVSQDLSLDPGGLERYYRQWFAAFGGSEPHRDFCRIKITNIKLESFQQTPVYRQFLSAFKTYTSFRNVIVELGEAPDPQLVQGFPFQPDEASLWEGNDPPEEPEFAGVDFEALKTAIAIELTPYLGNCHYYDRGYIRCLEFRPRPRPGERIEPGSPPYIDSWQP